MKKFLIKDITSNLNKIKFAKITDKQAIYIINNVILTRAAYQMQSTYLSKRSCNSITNIYTNIVKQKARLARSTPNSTLYHPNIYALNTLYNTQQQQQIRTLD